MPRVRDLLSDAGEKVRAAALSTLGAIAPDDPAVHAVLLASVQDPAPRIRESALEGLGMTRNMAFRAIVETKLADADPEVRAQACDALVELRVPAAELVPVFRRFEQDSGFSKLMACHAQ